MNASDQRERYQTPGPEHVGQVHTVDAGDRGRWRGTIKALTPIGVIVDTTAQWITSGTAGWVTHPKDPRHLIAGRIVPPDLAELPLEELNRLGTAG